MNEFDESHLLPVCVVNEALIHSRNSTECHLSEIDGPSYRDVRQFLSAETRVHFSKPPLSSTASA